MRELLLGFSIRKFSSHCNMSLLIFPNELLLMIAKELDKPKDVISLLQANHRFAFILTPVLHEFPLRTRDYGEAALFWAAASGHESMARLLLERGLKMEIEGASGKLLHRAPGKCDDATIRLVLGEGANLIISNSLWKMTALQWAASRGRRALVELLLSKGADTSVQDHRAHTALCLAVLHKHKAVIDLLLKEVEVTFVDRHGRTPLHVAAKCCDATVARSLLDRGADIAAVDNENGCTPLLTAVRRGDEALVLVELLLERGASIGDRDSLQRTALHLAAANKGIKTAELLVERGADVNSQDSYLRTSLHVAVQFGCPVVGLLLEKGAAIDVQDIFGRTALLLAAQRGSDSAVRLLVEKGADATISDNCGRLAPGWVLE